MGLGNLIDRATGQTITAEFFNSIHASLNADFVGRNSSGVATANQSLGTLAFPWGTIYAMNLNLNGQAIDTSSITSPANRVVSGITRAVAGSNLPQFLVPDGAAPQFVINGTPTNLVLVVNSATVTVNTDITKGSLTAAPSSNNTCLVDDVEAADQFDTKMWGSPYHRKSIIVDTMGSEITALIGTWQSFMIAGTTNEYMMAFVKSATELTNCYRGYYYDSTLAPVKPCSFSNNDVITLMKQTAVFVEDNGTTVDVSYRNPAWSFVAPSSPVTGDYWFDMANNVWKRYDGATFQIINRTFVGWVLQNTTNCVAARCEDFYAKFGAENTIVLDVSTTEIVRAREANASINVAGTVLNFGQDRPKWNITTDLAGSADMHDATEQADRTYFTYVKQNGDEVISDIFPFWNPHRFGWFHPYNTWRMTGLFRNDGSLDIVSVATADQPSDERFEANTGNGHGAVNTRIRRYTTVAEQMAGMAYAESANDGASLTVQWPGIYEVGGWDRAGGSYFAGISKNSATLTTSINSLTSAEIVTYAQNTSGEPVPYNAVISLKVGDVIRPHDDAAPSDTSAAGVRFHATRVGRYQ